MYRQLDGSVLLRPVGRGRFNCAAVEADHLSHIVLLSEEGELRSAAPCAHSAEGRGRTPLSLYLKSMLPRMMLYCHVALRSTPLDLHIVAAVSRTTLPHSETTTKRGNSSEEEKVGTCPASSGRSPVRSRSTELGSKTWRSRRAVVTHKVQEEANALAGCKRQRKACA